MDRRERIKRSLNHQEPDRVLIDLGSTLCTGIHVFAYERLAKYLDIKVPDPIIHDIMQQLALPDEEILKFLDVDFRGIFASVPDNNTERFLEDGTWVDEWGVQRKKPENGFYYDMVKSPLDGDDLSFKDIEDFNWPDPYDPGRTRGLREKAIYLKENTDYGIVANFQPVFIHMSQYLRGFKNWYMDFLLNPGVICEILDRVLDFYFKFGDSFFDAVGEYADIIMCADDVCTQTGCMISPELYRKHIKPRQAKLFEYVHKNTKAKLMYHCCGNVMPIIEDFIEIGIDILNPIQVSANEMDNTLLLKEKYGDKIVFWGAIDTQKILSFGTIEDVKKEVEKRIVELAPNGGYICGPVHDIQPNITPEKIIALFEHAKEFGRYPIKK